MKFNQSVIAKFQEGGPMPAEDQTMATAPEAAPEEQGAAPEDQMAQMAQQLVDMLMQQIGDPAAVQALLQMALDMISQAAQPQPAAYQRQGGRLVRVK